MMMGYAFYFDPAKKYHIFDMPQGNTAMAFWRLLDCDAKQMRLLQTAQYPASDLTIAEIYPEQLRHLPQKFERLCLVHKGQDLWRLYDLPDGTVDITLMWDGRYRLQRYVQMLEAWIARGVMHFSFYNIRDFDVLQGLHDVLQSHGFYFYDRYHAARPGHESPYQKHLARYGNVVAWGGQSRITDAQHITRIKNMRSARWQVLSSQEQSLEHLLFALADADGIGLAEWRDVLSAQGIKQLCDNGLALVVDGRLKPTLRGMWDSVFLVSKIYN